MIDNIKPKVTIIVPVFNAEKYIKKCLDSLVYQTLSNIEIVCVDDCSTDGSLEIIRQYAETDSRIRVIIHEENLGPGVARNNGLNFARGEYIMFLDSDDWYEQDACECAYNKIKQNDNDLAIFGFNEYAESTGIYKYNNSMLRGLKEEYENPRIILNDIEKNFIISCFGWAAIYKREFINEYNIRFPQNRHFEDQIFFQLAVLYSKTISLINKALYNYRIRENSLTFTYDSQHKDIFETKSIIINEMSKITGDNNIKTALYVHAINSSIYWFKWCSSNFGSAEKVFYKNINKIFKLLDKEYIERNVKHRLKEINYETYKCILKYNYYQFKFMFFLKKCF